jgi:hypothetical protein
MVRIKTLLNLLGSGVAVLALAPVLPFLSPLVIGVAVVGVLGGLWCDRYERYPLNTLTATMVAVAGIAYYGIQITRADVATPVAQAMIVLLAIRLLTPKESRDYLQIFVLGLFILAASSLISLDLGLGFGFLTYLVLMVFCVTLGLVLLTVFVTDKRLALPREDLYKLVKVSLIMPVVSLLLMLVFFFVLPRTRHPLWNFLNPGGTANVGLAESVQPGAYAQISANKRLAFRAEVGEISQDNLYWRALVLNQPEGSRWVRVQPPKENSRITKGNRTVKLTIYPEARSDRYLITLDRPSQLSGPRNVSNDDYVFVSRSALDHPYRLEQVSHPGANLKVQGRIDRGFYLTLPEQVSERVRQVTAGIMASTKNGQGRLDALAGFFRNQQLSYAQDDLPGGPDPVDEFLFDKKRGYCEFFASAYVTLARLSGIPARLVGGYYGGEYNPFGGYYLVTEDTAHVWVEVLTEDNRWVRIDPSQWAVNAGSALNNRGVASLGAMQRLIDSLNYRWVQTVLLFDFARQVEILNQTREKLRGIRSGEFEVEQYLWVAWLLPGTILVVLLRRRKRLSAEARLLEDFRLRVRKRYGKDTVSSASGLTELGERLDDDRCRDFAIVYQGAIFRDRPLSETERAYLRELLKKI